MFKVFWTMRSQKESCNKQGDVMQSEAIQPFKFNNSTATSLAGPPRKLSWRTLLAASALSAMVFGIANAHEEEHEEEFQVSSSTFNRGAALPTSMADNYLVNGTNVCTADGSTGGNHSPDLAWENAPRDTLTFVVILFDETASFTHWGIYNLSASTTFLPAGAGVAYSVYGLQVNNDFGTKGYEGPCPPANFAPLAHHYVFTVYALNIKLHLPVLQNFPQNSETLLRALAQAGAEGHVLGKANIGGFFSTTPGL